MGERRTTEEEQENHEDVGTKVREAVTNTFSQKRPKRERRNLKYTVKPEDATWISSLLYDECNRGLIEVRIHATPGPHSIDMEVAIFTLVTVSANVLITRGLNTLMDKIKERLGKSVQEKPKSAKGKRTQKKRRLKKGSG